MCDHDFGWTREPKMSVGSNLQEADMHPRLASRVTPHLQKSQGGITKLILKFQSPDGEITDANMRLLIQVLVRRGLCVRKFCTRRIFLHSDCQTCSGPFEIVQQIESKGEGSCPYELAKKNGLHKKTVPLLGSKRTLGASFARAHKGELQPLRNG